MCLKWDSGTHTNTQIPCGEKTLLYKQLCLLVNDAIKMVLHVSSVWHRLGSAPWESGKSCWWGMVSERHLRGHSCSEFLYPLLLWVGDFSPSVTCRGCGIGPSIKDQVYKYVMRKWWLINALVHNNTSVILGVKPASWRPGKAGRIQVRRRYDLVVPAQCLFF